MKLNLFILAICIVVTTALTMYLNRPHQPNIKDVPVETIETVQEFPETPYFFVPTLEGKNPPISNFKGKTIILNFWATWCAPCEKEFPQLLELANKQKEDLILIAISVDAEKENIGRFLNKFDQDIQEKEKLPNVILAWDPNKKISQDLFQTLRYPETYIIAPDQTLRQKIVGADVDFSSEEFIQTLQKAVQ